MNHSEAAIIVHSLLFLNRKQDERTRVAKVNDDGVKIIKEGWKREDMVGNFAIGSNSAHSGDPFPVLGRYGYWALCTTGEIANLEELCLEHYGSNAELFAHLVFGSNERFFKDALTSALEQVRGSFAFSALRDDKIYAGCCGEYLLVLARFHRQPQAYIIASDVQFLLSVASVESRVRQNQVLELGLQAELLAT